MSRHGAEPGTAKRRASSSGLARGCASVAHALADHSRALAGLARALALAAVLSASPAATGASGASGASDVSSASSASPAGPGGGSATHRPLSFALIGDIPYSPLEVGMVTRIFGSLDDDIGFVVHVGDLKGSWEPCSDALIAERHALLDQSPVPLVFTPGDNEWTDCHRRGAGGFDPLERLAALRNLFFARAEALGGKPRDSRSAARAGTLALQRQADATPGGPPENLRWRAGGALFATINLPGSRNASEVEKRHPGSTEAREQWNEAWLREAYAIAEREGLAAVVVIGQANPHFGRSAGAPYAGFQRVLGELSSRFPGHTLFLHGDTHRHSVKRLGERLLGVESYGSPFSNLWVRIDLDPAAAQPFRITSRQTDPEPPRP